jgi:hypothetical protein
MGSVYDLDCGFFTFVQGNRGNKKGRIVFYSRQSCLTTASSLTAARERFLRKPNGHGGAAAAEAERWAS